MKTHLLLMLLAIGLIACNKDSKKDKDTSFSRQESRSEKLIDEVNSIVDEAASSGALNTYKLDGSDLILASGCATVTLDTIAFPRTVTIDFGDGCVGNDGKTRKGKILANFTGPYRASGTVITISTQDYFVEGNQIIGNPLRVVNNQGPNADGHPTFTINVTGKIIFANDGGTIDWTAQRTRVWTAGFNTFFLADDRYTITGGANASNSDGISWNSTITSPLNINMAIGCRQIVSGTLLITSNSRPDRTIDYGNGACDNTFTVTVNGNTYTVVF